MKNRNHDEVVYHGVLTNSGHLIYCNQSHYYCDIALYEWLISNFKEDKYLKIILQFKKIQITRSEFCQLEAILLDNIQYNFPSIPIPVENISLW